MKSFRKTGLLALFAVVSCAVAYFYYPKIQQESQSQMLSEDLFAKYERADVYEIEIEEFDREKNALQRLKLKNRNGLWSIPEKDNYIVTRAELISLVPDALLNCEVLQEISSQESDQEKYGVVDPRQASQDVGGVGKLIRLTDGSRNEIGSLIVGSPTRDEGQCFVRIPGQPQIYVVAFNRAILRTDFASWMEGDLMRLRGDESPAAVRLIDMRYYRMNDQVAGTEPGGSSDADLEKKQVYRVRAYPGQKSYQYDLWIPDQKNQLSKKATIEKRPIPQEGMEQLVTWFSQAEVQDVRKKSRRVSEAILRPQATDDDRVFKSLESDGFFYTGMANGQHQFDAANGEVAFAFDDGSLIRIYIGGLAGIDRVEKGKVSRHVMVIAEVVEAALPMPPKPKSLTDAEMSSETQEVAEQQVAAEREYQKRLQQRNAQLEQARRRADMINQLRADWIYVVGESTIDSWLMPVENWVPQRAPATQPKQ